MQGGLLILVLIMSVLYGQASAYTNAVSRGGSYVVTTHCAEAPLFVFGGIYWRKFGGDTARNAVYRWDVGLGEKSQICRENRRIEAVAVSVGGLIAFIQHLEEEERSILSIVDLDGNRVREVDGNSWIRNFCWSPDGNRIVYITGRSREEARAYDDARVFLYSFPERKSELLAEKGYEIAWPAFDGRVYLYEPQGRPRVHVIDVGTREIRPTEYENIRFSPQGKYYFDPGDEGGAFRIYSRETNEALAAPLSSLALSRLEAIRWFDDKSLICFQQVGAGGRWLLHPTYILDVETGQIRKGSHYILEAYQPGTVVEITPEGTLLTEKVAEMPIINPEDLPLRPGQE